MTALNSFSQVLYDISDWVEKPKPKGSVFAHIKVQGAAGDIYEVPARLYGNRVRWNTKMALVVADSKLSMINKNLPQRIADINWSVEEDGDIIRSHMEVLSYGQLFNMLKNWRDQNTWNVDAQTWCSRFTVFLMDVDPGFSAEFVLALNATAIFAKTYTEQRPTTLVKLMTMSSSIVHPVIGKLFNHFNSCQNFQFPEVQDTYAPRHVIANNMNQALLQMESWVHDRGQNEKHTIITFCGEDIIPDEWRGNAWIQSFIHVQLLHPGYMEAVAANTQHRRVLISFPPDFQADIKFPATGTVHVVPSVRQRRTIWSWRRGHEIEVTLSVTNQEREAQMSASSWFEVDDISVYTYAPDGYLTSPELDLPLSVKFACEQIEGFVAALTDLENWPDETFDILRLFKREDPEGSDDTSSEDDPTDYSYYHGCLSDVETRLKIQGLLGHHHTMGSAIAPQHVRLFHKVNEGLSYNGKVAYAMAFASAPNFTLLKMHLAAALSVGLKRLVKIDWQGCDAQAIRDVRSLANWSRTSQIAPYGTLWAKLGMMEAIWTKHAAGLCPSTSASEIVDGRVSASTTTRSMWMACRQRISNWLTEEHVSIPTQNDFFRVDWQVGEIDYLPLCYDFLRAYSNQVAMVSRHEDRLEFVDFTSWEPLNCTQDVLNLVNWDKIAEYESFPLIGFYTASIELPDEERVVISDWNWIPAGLWTTWGQIIKSNDYIGSEALKVKEDTDSENSEED
ncbi:hypothetical protein IL306_013353 [Fusarium sp. DS 682]|nr:hypothetical protein IL306_013353 [Fusarium sp. DS 682]